MRPAETHPTANHAIVARTADHDGDHYLQLPAAGAPAWVADPAFATTFPSMREATRMASRLPSRLRAFGLPREPELALFGPH